MKRFVIALTAFVVLVGIVFVSFFAASDFNKDDQPFFMSLSDFTFMIGQYNARFLRLEPPELTERSYERVMWHARRTADHETDDAVFFALERWGSAVEPRLVEEIELWHSDGRVLAAATVLSRLGNPAAVTALDKAVAMGHNRALEIDIIDELYRVGPAAAPRLIRLYREAKAADLPPHYNIIESIGRTGAPGAEFLLGELAAATTEEEIHGLQWALAYSDDPRAARALFGLMHHRSLDIRRRSRDAMSQVMSGVAVDPAIDFLEPETDDYLRSWIIRNILADRRSRDSNRAADYLAALVAHPVLSNDANYALARTGNERAIDVLRARGRDQPRWAIRNLEYAGSAGIRILEDLIHHDDAYVRRQVLWKLEELDDYRAAPIFEAALSDPDPINRSEARRMAFQLAPFALGNSYNGWLSELIGRPVNLSYRSPTRGATQKMVTVLRIMHWVGLVVSALLGFLLLIGSLRAFEPYKFALVLQFLLVAGIVGDFFLMPDPASYRWATTARFVLLLGLLFLRDDPLPGEVRGRIERFGVRSLWILAPTLLVYGVPAFTLALREALRDFDFTKWVFLLLLMLTVLLLEQTILPWHLLSRGSRFERAITLALSTSVVAIFVVALWKSSAEGDRATLNALLTLPLVVAVLFHTKSSRLFAKAIPPPSLPPAPGRIRALEDAESVIVKLKRRKSFHGVPQLVLGGLALWFLVAKLEVGQGNSTTLMLLMFASVFGTVLGWLLLAIVKPGFTIQIRDGAARSGNSVLGGVLGAARWHHRLRIPALITEVNLNPTEKRWLARALSPT